jgi:hypothetical protein
MWKENAKFAIANKNYFIKYEDWLTNKKVRDNILSKYFGTYEIFGPETIKGRQSSFDNNDFNNRFSQIELPEEIKELIKNDCELHYLIGALGYEYKEI